MGTVRTALRAAGDWLTEEQRPETDLVTLGWAGRLGPVLAAAGPVAGPGTGPVPATRAAGDWLTEEQRPETDLAPTDGRFRTPDSEPGGAPNSGRVPGGGPAPTPAHRPQARAATEITAGAPAPQISQDDEATIDCLVTHHPNLPRDRMGNRLNDAGRWLITEAVASLYGVRLRPRELARDEHRRWSVPALGLTASVAHCATYSTVALVSDQTVGVDLQDHRDRPYAMQWLGALLGRPDGEPATMRDFAECEALIKASHLRKETFAGVRLPDWRPGWRPTNTGHLIRSADLGHGLHLALATDAPAAVRWWWQPNPTAPATRTEALTPEAAA
ncbi:hypothetical protein ACFYSX_29955 [Kitasatospora sp. NPDC004622]|uniref:hypothetical protein n=1 Tax=Kitasatospora sp. NPDC004622 TaxID=3364018 RepID=UPI0036AE5E3F